jgi:hypothetical protein
MSAIDQFSDTAFGTLYRQINRMPAMEEFVKQATIEPSEADALPDSAFAWPSERKFPLHTPEHAMLSYAYSKVASELPEEVRANIAQALEVYAVPESIFQEETAKVASEDNQYLLPTLRLFRVTNPEQCKRAQEELVESLPKLDMEHRVSACAELVKRADELNVELRPEVLQLAGLVVSNTKTARDWVEARANKLPEDAKVFKLAYQTLADGLKQKPVEIFDRKGLMKFASVLAELDEQSGLDKHYDRNLPDAVRTVFNTEKQAAHSVDLGGTFVPMKKIAALPASFWEDLGGKELRDEVAPGGEVDQSKLAVVVDTLPLDLKLQLRAHCR